MPASATPAGRSAPLGLERSPHLGEDGVVQRLADGVVGPKKGLPNRNEERTKRLGVFIRVGQQAQRRFGKGLLGGMGAPQVEQNASVCPERPSQVGEEGVGARLGEPTTDVDGLLGGLERVFASPERRLHRAEVVEA